MRKLAAVIIALVFISACKGQGEKWVHYIADTAGNAIDTMSVTINEHDIVLEARGGWNWTRRDAQKHDDIFKYEILDQMHLPSDPRKTTYHVKADNGIELNFSIYRVEKDRAAVNFGQLTYNGSTKEKPFHERFDSAYVTKELEQMHWQSPWFFSDSLVGHLKTLKGVDAVNSDTVLWYCKARLEYVKQHKDRFERWGPVGNNYIYEEPGVVAMEAMGYNPWRVYSQLQWCCYPSDDSAYVQIDKEYRALLETIK